MRIIGNNPAADNAEITAVASGTLPSGQPVIVNADGTVSVIAGTAQAVGSPTVFNNSGATNYNSAIFDSNSNKVVIAYTDGGNSTYGTAIVGTVSGTSISFGSEVVFESAATSWVSTTFDSNSNKVVIAYSDSGNLNYGTAIVGTVSGTSISFGSPVVFESSNATTNIGTTFDSNSNKVVFAYRDHANSNYGTAIVGTVNGTSISFGTAVVYESALSLYNSATFDSNLNKVVIAYGDSGNSSYGTAVVGTVSGTGISFGSPVVFSSASTNPVVATFDSNSNKVVFAYRNLGNAAYGTAIVGTVSGTSISFGTAVVFDATNSSYISTTFDSNSNKVVVSYRTTTGLELVSGEVSGTSISFDSPVVLDATGIFGTACTFDSALNKIVVAYRDSGNSNYGTGIVFQNESTTLTSENFIGFANGAAVDGGTARVQIGGGINGAQSGLTAGQQYFVQSDGTIGLTAADPSVIAGTAISATEIIVKG